MCLSSLQRKHPAQFQRVQHVKIAVAVLALQPHIVVDSIVACRPAPALLHVQLHIEVDEVGVIAHKPKTDALAQEEPLALVVV